MVLTASLRPDTTSMTSVHKVTAEQQDYIQYFIDKEYNSERLTNILTEMVEMIGAKILNISSKILSHEAPVTVLIAEDEPFL